MNKYDLNHQYIYPAGSDKVAHIIDDKNDYTYCRRHKADIAAQSPNEGTVAQLLVRVKKIPGNRGLCKACEEVMKQRLAAISPMLQDWKEHARVD